MSDNYEIEYKKLMNEFIEESEIALKESEQLYNDIVNKLGHKNFFANNINTPTKECYQKYKIKFKNLKEKYHKK